MLMGPGLAFKVEEQLEAENAALRHQLIILCRQRHVRARLTNNDRLVFIQLYRWFPSILKVRTVVRDARPVALGGFSQLLALEIAFAGKIDTDASSSSVAIFVSF